MGCALSRSNACSPLRVGGRDDSGHAAEAARRTLRGSEIGTSVVTVQVVQVMLRQEGRLAPRSDAEGVTVQTRPC